MAIAANAVQCAGSFIAHPERQGCDQPRPLVPQSRVPLPVRSQPQLGATVTALAGDAVPHGPALRAGDGRRVTACAPPPAGRHLCPLDAVTVGDLPYALPHREQPTRSARVRVQKPGLVGRAVALGASTSARTQDARDLLRGDARPSESRNRDQPEPPHRSFDGRAFSFAEKVPGSYGPWKEATTDSVQSRTSGPTRASR